MNPIIASLLVGLVLVAIPTIVILATSPDLCRIARQITLKEAFGGALVFTLLFAVIWIAMAIL